MKYKSMSGPFWLILVLAGLSGLLFNMLTPQGVGFLPSAVTDPKWQPVSLSQARLLWSQGALFIDARDPGQYREAHVRGAMNLYPQDMKLLYKFLAKKITSAPQVVIYGKSFSRFPAARVAQFLTGQGVKVRVLGRPFKDWLLAGYPVKQKNHKAKS